MFGILAATAVIGSIASGEQENRDADRQELVDEVRKLRKALENGPGTTTPVNIPVPKRVDYSKCKGSPFVFNK